MPDKPLYVEGNQLRRDTFAAQYAPGPTGTLVRRLLEALAGVTLADGKTKPFQNLFGKFVAFDSLEQRWACYPKWDWTLRQLPAINCYENEPEQKQSDNGWLEGTVRLMIFWPASMRRPDLQQIPVMFKGALQNFFSSRYCEALLDPHPTLNVATKVPGLNRLGRELTWSPQVEGNVDGGSVPLTILDVKYRIDLRRWQDFLRAQDRTVEDPFEATLADFIRVQGVYQGVTDGENDPATNQGDAQVVDGYNIPDA